MDSKGAVQERFGPAAGDYATSAVHAGGPDLAAMVAAAGARGGERLLDVATGAGHTALAFAPLVREVVAVDLTEAMLATGGALAAERGLANVAFQLGDVEALPFGDAAFDLVTCRYAGHHFPRPRAALREMARVLKPGGSLLLVDVVSFEDPAADTVLNAIEVLRDTSHVRDHTVAQWRAWFGDAGLESEELGSFPLRLEFASWVARMRTPPVAIAAIRALLDAVPESVRAALRAEPDGTFTAPVALLRGRRG
jgi:SAM-dependent methyltransferase